jgi:hypothetical protein
MDVETIQKLFKDMPLDCQLQILQQFGFQVGTLEENIEVEQMQNARVI